MEEIKKTENNLEKEHEKAVDYKDAPIEPKNSKVDTYSYKGWLNSDSFFKRAFSIAGYQMVATLIFQFAFMGIILIFVLIVSVLIFVFG